MHDIVVQIPDSITLSEGQSVSWEMEGTVRNGVIVVEKIAIDTPVSTAPNRELAVRKFQARWSGALESLSSADEDEARWEYLREKYLS